MSLDDFLQIETPENVAFGYEVAGIGSRFLAALVDTAIIVFLQIIVGLGAGIVGQDLGIFEAGPAWVSALFGLLGFLLLWGYYIFFETISNGQTPGKRWAGLRVVRTDGLPISLSEATIRNLVRLIDFLPIGYGVGVVTMFANEQSRRLGDLAAGTLVVREDQAVTLDSLQRRPLSYAPVTWPGEPELPELPVDRLSASEIQMAEAFLERRHSLGNRRALARQVAQALYRSLELPPEQTDGWDAETAILGIVQAYRRQNEAAGHS